jgi:hypothetical protein
MQDSTGYDDLFNDGCHRHSLHNSIQARPNLWPLSTTKMREKVAHDEWYRMTPDQYEASRKNWR